MFAVDSSVVSLRALLSGQKRRANLEHARCRSDSMSSNTAHSLICDALAEMLPSTLEELAQATQLDAAAAAACLEDLAGRSRVMFNPLTKRYSLPKAALRPGIAA